METKSKIFEASSIIQLIILQHSLFFSSILGRFEISMDCWVLGENIQVVGSLSQGYLEFWEWNFVNYHVGLNNSWEAVCQAVNIENLICFLLLSFATELSVGKLSLKTHFIGFN